MPFEPLVLCYHAASNRWQHALAVPPDRLLGQVRLLARRRRPVAASEVARGIGRLLHVTFDDAFRNVSEVLPGLERIGAPVTIFACPEYADGGRPLDVPELAADAEALPEELRTMTWEELRAVAERPGVEIGAHTLSHPHLTRLSDEELRRELAESKSRLEAELGRECRFLAYPYGEEDARVNERARTAGYEGAFGLPGDSSGANPFSLPRVGVWQKDGRLRFELKTRPALRRLVRR